MGKMRRKWKCHPCGKYKCPEQFPPWSCEGIGNEWVFECNLCRNARLKAKGMCPICGNYLDPDSKYTYCSKCRTEGRLYIKRGRAKVQRRARDAFNGYMNEKNVFKYLGCTREKLIQHIESQFKPGMSWDNYGPEWNLDHIIPVSHVNLNKPQDLRMVSHYLNLRPLWKKKNSGRGNSIGFLDRIRIYKIRKDISRCVKSY